MIVAGMIVLGIIGTLLALFLLRVLRLFLSRFIHRPSDQVIPFLRKDDPATLAELLDAVQERWLRETLSHHQFRKLQLNRMRLCRERVDCRAHNVTIWQEWGDTQMGNARLTGDEEIRAAADRLVVACAGYRIGASAIQAQLRIWEVKLLLLPFAEIPRLSRLRKADDLDLLLSYEMVKELALKLADLCGGDFPERLRQAL